MGYSRAGFEVVGVDIEPQPNYPFEFVQADVMEVLDEHGLVDVELGWPDAIHASPPCQAFTNARVIQGREHPDLLTPTRKLLKATGLPWVIENVPGAPMRPDVVLCGSQFPELRSANGFLRRHRWFEFSNPTTMMLHPCWHRDKTISVFGHGGHVYHGVEDWREVMGIDWMTRDELSEAIPPAYAELVGHQLIQQLQKAAA